MDELGIRDVGDVSQLTEEEQRRIKLKNKVDELARDSSEEFAQIVKSWLSE